MQIPVCDNELFKEWFSGWGFKGLTVVILAALVFGWQIASVSFTSEATFLAHWYANLRESTSEFVNSLVYYNEKDYYAQIYGGMQNKASIELLLA